MRQVASLPMGALVCAVAPACDGELHDAAIEADTVADAAETALDAGPDAALDAAPDVARQPSGPPYPIVLAHGFLGFDDFARSGTLHYFYGVREDLAELGVRAFTPAVNPFNDSAHRGRELLTQVERIIAETGAAKVDLIGHSQGGLDARVVAALRPDLVASVTTIGTPNRGAYVVDVSAGLVASPLLSSLEDWMARFFGPVLYEKVDGETSLSAALEQLSTPGVEAFDKAWPDAPGVAYYSIAGRTDLDPGGADCVPDREVAFVSDFAGVLDTVDPIFALTESVIDGGLLGTTDNDGLVRASEARWGTFLGCLPADHVDQVGQFLGDPPGLGNGWNHFQFFRDLVAFLRDEGF